MSAETEIPEETPVPEVQPETGPASTDPSAAPSEATDAGGPESAGETAPATTPDPFAVLAAIGAHPEAFANAAAEAAEAGKSVFVRQASTRGLGLAGIRALDAAVGPDAFANLMTHLRPADLLRLAQSADPHKPGLPGSDAKALASHVASLAAGAEPTASADIGEIDLEGLRAARTRLGDADFASWLAALRITELKKTVVRLDPHRPGLPGLDIKGLRSHLAGLAGDVAPTVEVEMETLDLAGLRTAREYLGDGFATWLSTRKQGECKKALARIDPHRPGLAGLDLDGLRAQVGALAEGAEPSAAIPLDDLDLAGLGAAREEIGQEAFDAWLAGLKPAEVKKAVIRLDPERPGVRKLKPAEYVEVLGALAERMSPFSGRQGVPSVTEITFGRVRHDEERYPDEGANGDE